VSSGNARPATPSDSGDAVLVAALRAVARTRALGMHYYGHLLGIASSRPDEGRPRPHLDPDPAVIPDVVPPVALAAIADLAVGSAVRAALGAGRRLGTVSLTLHHIGSSARAPVRADPTLLWADTDTGDGLARCDLRDARGELVGAAQGWFLALPVPDGRQLPPLPWERESAPTIEALAEADLDERERAAVTATLRAHERARERGTSTGEELTSPVWSESAAEGSAQGTLQVGPEVTNRVGHVQGGALYGIALAAAARAVGPGMEVAEGHYQFVRPADGERIVVDGAVLRRGRAAAFAEASLSVEGRRVGVARFAFRPPLGGNG
jgi:acyl-coenzyme A thioesterase PaaI-like protein